MSSKRDVTFGQPIIEMEQETMQTVLDQSPHKHTDAEQEARKERVHILQGNAIWYTTTGTHATGTTHQAVLVNGSKKLPNNGADPLP